MTSLLLHGIIRADAPGPPAGTLGHLRITAGELAGLARPVAAHALSAEGASPMAEVEAHHDLLSAYAVSSDLVPVRFGTAFSGQRAIVDMLRSEVDTHLARLARVASCVEYTLKLSRIPDRPRQAVAPGQENGRAFLKQKQKVRDAQRSLAKRRTDFVSEVLNQATDAVQNSVMVPSPSAQIIAASALLVARKTAPDLLDVLRHLSVHASACGVAVALQGPGPCYSFADDDLHRDVSVAAYDSDRGKTLENA
ncbi:MAG: GvpL/GvpF family gas vesicle protein [Pseudomonadota bacterium]